MFFQMLGKIFFVAGQEFRNTGVGDVDLTVNFFFLFRLHSSDPQVAVDATIHTLKQFLIRLPSRRHDPFAVIGIATDQPIAGNQR